MNLPERIGSFTLKGLEHHDSIIGKIIEVVEAERGDRSSEDMEKRMYDEEKRLSVCSYQFLDGGIADVVMDISCVYSSIFDDVRMVIEVALDTIDEPDPEATFILNDVLRNDAFEDELKRTFVKVTEMIEKEGRFWEYVPESNQHMGRYW